MQTTDMWQLPKRLGAGMFPLLLLLVALLPSGGLCHRGLAESGLYVLQPGDALVLAEHKNSPREILVDMLFHATSGGSPVNLTLVAVPSASANSCLPASLGPVTGGTHVTRLPTRTDPSKWCKSSNITRESLASEVARLMPPFSVGVVLNENAVPVTVDKLTFTPFDLSLGSNRGTVSRETVIGLSVALGVLCLATVVAGIWFVRRQCNKKEGVEEHRDKATAAMESGGATDEEVKERR